MIEVLGIKNADKLVPIEDDMRPTDPVSENMDALAGNPVKAFMYQDHQAHIATHQAFMQDPMVMQTIGQNPQGEPNYVSLCRLTWQSTRRSMYRQQIEDASRCSTTGAINEQMPERPRNTTRAATGAGGYSAYSSHTNSKLLNNRPNNRRKTRIIQMQQAELQLKQAELQRKAAKDQADAQLDAARLQLDAQKAQTTATIESNRIAAQNEQAQAKNDLDEAKAILDMAKAQQQRGPQGG
jgi:hypothetical protein